MGLGKHTLLLSFFPFISMLLSTITIVVTKLLGRPVELGFLFVFFTFTHSTDRPCYKQSRRARVQFLFTSFVV